MDATAQLKYLQAQLRIAELEAEIARQKAPTPHPHDSTTRYMPASSGKGYIPVSPPLPPTPHYKASGGYGAPATRPCKFGRHCNKGDKCLYGHPTAGAGTGTKPCRNGDACFTKRCPFSHPSGDARLGIKHVGTAVPVAPATVTDVVPVSSGDAEEDLLAELLSMIPKEGIVGAQLGQEYRKKHGHTLKSVLGDKTLLGFLGDKVVTEKSGLDNKYWLAPTSG